MGSVFLCIDLKTFFASVECVERKLDPFTTNLVVADPSRGKGTICLAISPKMKMLGVKNRCRVYDIPPNIKYIMAPPRMSKYIEYSANIYSIYLKYLSKDDIHVYSIDEAFLDITHYLKAYKMRALDVAKMITKDIYDTYGLTATVGIGTNLYLTKIALDIISKHSSNNIGWLDEEKYKRELWHHKPLSDFWQIGRGIEKRLNKLGIHDMYDLAHYNEQRLYKEFGVNAEFLIDHAHGRESCTMADIKSYVPKSNSISNSQVLFRDYDFDKALVVLKEMVELKSLELIEKNLTTSQISLYIGYSGNIINSTGGLRRLKDKTNTYNELAKEYTKLYYDTTNKAVPIRRIGISFSKLEDAANEQLNLFRDNEKIAKERELENAMSVLKYKLGKNAVLRCSDFTEGATAIERNKLIGGHNAN